MNEKAEKKFHTHFYSDAFQVCHIEIAPRYSGILYSFTNTFATISGQVAPLVAGYVTQRVSPTWCFLEKYLFAMEKLAIAYEHNFCAAGLIFIRPKELIAAWSWNEQIETDEIAY